MVDLSSSTDPRIAVASQVLAEIEAVGARHGIPLMVVGATADVAVAVPSWKASEALTADFRTIVGRYATGRLLDELYDLDASLLETHDFDPALTSAHRLGRHMAELLCPSAGVVAALLDNENLGRLVADMPASVADHAAVLRALREGPRPTCSV